MTAPTNSSRKRKAKTADVAPAPEVQGPREPTRLAQRMREETWSIDRIRPYERNAREHPQTQIDQIRASYREFGEVQRIVVDEDGELIAGHGRHEALKQENVVEVRVAIAIGWTDEQKRRFRIIDNQLGLNSSWNEKLLKAEVQALDGLGVDVGLLGFEPGRIAGLKHVAPAGNTDPDETPEEPAVPTSARGDVWILGRHRLTCGDSTNPEDVKRVLAGAKPHLMVTDPPYGVKYDASWRVKVGHGGEGNATGKVLNDDRADWREAWELFPGDVAYVWHAGSFSGVVSQSLEACRFKIRAQIIWVKPRHTFGRGDYHFQHEPAWYAVKDGGDEAWHFVPEHEVAAYTVREGKTGHYVGGRKQSTVWNIEHMKSETGHSTQKPVECMKRPVENNSQPGDAIYEPFSGSGTTIIACEITGRRCLAIELNPAYVDIDVVRWQAFTGHEARLERDGRTFAEVAAARAAELDQVLDADERISA